MKIDFFARRAHFVEHIAPVWKALDPEARGAFYVSAYLRQYAEAQGLEVVPVLPRLPADPLSGAPNGPNPLLTCAYGDMLAAYKVRPQRPFILMEHGVGLTFNNPSYAGGLGLRRQVALFLVPNEHTRLANARVMPLTPQAIVGVPKLDEWAEAAALATHVVLPGPSASARGGGSMPPHVGSPCTSGRRPTVCISFHWNGAHIAPEAGNAFQHYAGILPELAQDEAFTLIGHGHPKFRDLEQHFLGMGIRFVRDFRDVMEQADVYVNDSSSTLYEFCVTGKPVVILNAPQFRKNVHHGIRFWEYSDVGPQVNQPGELRAAIEQAIAEPDVYQVQREKAVQDLYPYLGESSARAARCIEDFLQSKWPGAKRIDTIGGETIGILYMGFGRRAALEISKSLGSLKRLGVEIPAVVVGDTPVAGAELIRWEGESPFDPAQRHNFQFRAGRIKPDLCRITPFERTLYIDADTEFLADITPGFQCLDEVDLALAEELLALGQLYNKPRAGWEINMIERDATIQELGGNPNRKFLNSGVIFFRRSEATLKLFEEWRRQWLRWQQWDEQLALMRAIHACGIRYKALSPDWNHPHRGQAKIIFHNYGRGTARVDGR